MGGGGKQAIRRHQPPEKGFRWHRSESGDKLTVRRSVGVRVFACTSRRLVRTDSRERKKGAGGLGAKAEKTLGLKLRVKLPV